MEDTSFDYVESSDDSNNNSSSTKPILFIAFLFIGILVGGGITYFVFPQSSDQSLSVDDETTDNTSREVYLAQEEIKALKNTVTDLQNSVNSKINEVENKNTEINDLNAQISSLSSDLNVLEDKISDSDSKISSLEIELENSNQQSVEVVDDNVDMGDDVEVVDVNVDMGDDVEIDVDMGDDVEIDDEEEIAEVNYLIEIASVDFVDMFGNPLSSYGAGDIIVVESTVINIHTEKVTFAVKVVIRESATNNVVYSQGVTNLELEPGGSFKPGISWIPQHTGNYIIEVHAVNDLLNLTPVGATNSENIEIT